MVVLKIPWILSLQSLSDLFGCCRQNWNGICVMNFTNTCQLSRRMYVLGKKKRRFRQRSNPRRRLDVGVHHAMIPLTQSANGYRRNNYLLHRIVAILTTTTLNRTTSVASGSGWAIARWKQDPIVTLTIILNYTQAPSPEETMHVDAFNCRAIHAPEPSRLVYIN